MAKVNWQLNDTVLPADMNQIGTEINDNTAAITNLGNTKADKANPSFTGNTSTTGTSTATRFISNIPNGTPPIAVTSSTKIDNLNADLVDGYNANFQNTPNNLVVRGNSGEINVGNVNANNLSGKGIIDLISNATDRSIRLTHDAEGKGYIQVLTAVGAYINNPLIFQEDGTLQLNGKTGVAYANPSAGQVRNIHQGRTAPSNSEGINGDLYVVW